MNIPKLSRKVTGKMLRTVIYDLNYPSRFVLTANDNYNIEKFGITADEARVIRNAVYSICGTHQIGRAYSLLTVKEVNTLIQETGGFA